MTVAKTASVTRIAMWSGPRNISTAMMRAFENRSDTAVWDEPLYGPYLHLTGKTHPMADRIVAEHGSDWRQIVKQIGGPVPDDQSVYYQKHMSHHLLPEMDREWITDTGLQNCFLIRDPASVLASYAHKRPGDEIDAGDLGFIQQAEIFDRVCDATGEYPIVLDAADVLKNPQGMLQLLCQATGIKFSDRMLRWPAGRRISDGVWSEHWYDNVWKSTGFAPWTEPSVQLAEHLKPVADQCYPYFRKLKQARRSIA